MAARLTILVVEDHDLMRESLVALLTESGHQVLTAASAEDVDDLASPSLPDLYLLDLNLPGEDGFSLARRIRAHNHRAGIIMLTARTQQADKVEGYASGADIYLTKPLAVGELIGAITALGRRLKPAEPDHDGLQLDAAQLQLSGPLGSIPLNQSEASLLGSLACAPDHLLERWQIASKLGLALDNSSQASLEVRIGRLRRKLQTVSGNPQAIRAIRGIGYKLCLHLTLK